MAFLVLRGERSLAAVVSRAYGDLPAAERKRAEEALLRANPRLANVREAGRGAVITVPRVPGVRAAPRDATDAGTPAPEAMAAVRESLSNYLGRVEVNVKTAQAGTTELTNLLKSAEVKRLVRELPGAGPHVERVTAAAKSRAGEHDERSTSLKRLAKADADLEALAKKLR